MRAIKLNHFNQQGAILVVGLIILSVLVMIGITAVNFTSLGEKLTGNQRNQELAIQAAESALVDAEQWLTAQVNVPQEVSSCTTLPCDVFSLGVYSNIHQNNASWWQTNGKAFSGTIDGVASQPYSMTEQYSFIPYELDPDARSKGEGYYYYQITSRGTGGNDTAVRTLRSIYTVQYK